MAPLLAWLSVMVIFSLSQPTQAWYLQDDCKSGPTRELVTDAVSSAIDMFNVGLAQLILFDKPNPNENIAHFAKLVFGEKVLQARGKSSSALSF